MDSNRVTWVDSAKGIGIILVVYGHVARGLHNGGILADSSLYRLLDASIYSFHMPLFFFLSGMFFLHSYRKHGLRFLRAKIGTIVYPYLVWSAIQTGIKIAMSGHTTHSAHYSDLFSIFFLPVEQFWFLYSLFLIFTVSSLLFATLTQCTASEQTIILATTIFSLLIFFFRPLFTGIFQIQTVASYMVYFTLGVCFTHFQRPTAIKRPLIGLPVCFLLLCYTIIYKKYWPADSLLIQLALALVGIGSIVTVMPSIGSRITSILSFFGKYSLEIYCAHVIAAGGLRIFLQYGLHISIPAIHLIGGMGAGLLLPILFTRLTTGKLSSGNFFFTAPPLLRIPLSGTRETNDSL